MNEIAKLSTPPSAFRMEQAMSTAMSLVARLQAEDPETQVQRALHREIEARAVKTVGEHKPAWVNALEPDAPVHHVDELLADLQAQPGSAVFPDG